MSANKKLPHGSQAQTKSYSGLYFNPSSTHRSSSSSSSAGGSGPPSPKKKSSFDSVDERSDEEKNLFTYIKAKDLKGVRETISNIANSTKSINVNCKDLDGNSLIYCAVKTKDQKIVQAVLDIDKSNIDTKEGLLQAIEDNVMGIVMQLLIFEDAKQQPQDFNKIRATAQVLLATKKTHLATSWKKGTNAPLDQNKYGNGITPMIQAAKHGRYEIMQVLAARGEERLPELHLPNCDCAECKMETRDMERILRRINLLKAKANPTYLIFMAGKDAHGDFDPVMNAFSLSNVIRKCIDTEPEYKKEYEEILEEVEKLPVDLIKLCRTMEETKIFLSNKDGFIGPMSTPYPRLAMAIENDQKKFVAEPNVQFLMHNEFVGETWIATSDFQRYLQSFFLILFSPLINIFIWLFLCCLGNSSLFQWLLSPLNRSLMKLGSHILFCILLIIMNSEERSDADIEPPTKYVRWVVLLYVFSLLLSLIRSFMRSPIVFFKRGWNIYDCITQTFFLASFGIWIYLFYRKNHLGFEETLPRRKLPRSDLLLIEECCFAVASTFATFRLTRWYLLNGTVGPFQTAYAHMANHMKTVLLFLLWVMLTFCVSSKLLYRPYEGREGWDAYLGRWRQQPIYMSDPKNMFLLFFGIGEELSPSQVEILPITPNVTDPEMTKEPEIMYHQDTTNEFMKIMCIVFNIVVMVFLKDATVGLFSSSGGEVLKNKDVEWKFMRVKEWLYYIEDSRLAPPFNLLPNWMCLCGGVSWIGAMISRSDSRRAGCDLRNGCYIMDVENDGENDGIKREYPFLMRSLFQRYFQQKKWTESEETVPNKADVQEVLDKVQELKKLKDQIDSQDGFEDFQPSAFSSPKPSTSAAAFASTTAPSMMASTIKTIKSQP